MLPKKKIAITRYLGRSAKRIEKLFPKEKEEEKSFGNLFYRMNFEI
jgi:hypothetical protein